MAGEFVREFSYEPDAKRRRIFHYDTEKDDGSFTIETQQDVTDLIDLNKRVANEADDNWKGELHRVASIPMNVLFDLEKKGIVKGNRIIDDKAFRRWLDDRDNLVFRTKMGRLFRASK